LAEEKRKQEEEARLAEEKRIQEEEARLAEEKRKQEEEEKEQQNYVYYENCDEAREAGAAPIRRGEAGYAKHLDRDGDGVGCDR
ncbi:excalibur calcium-binding domain-containing protein, partial [Bacillus sp. JJ722]|uniref:excalibur calcium-binding domain-containing protein n=1 Tax=Bacillus sp. JJ722 TaxID=3122973 RepID=UPI002FFFDCD9